MAILVTTCPHCMANDVALMTIASYDVQNLESWAALRCPRCDSVVGAKFRRKISSHSLPHIAQQHHGDFRKLVDLIEIQPRVRPPSVPAHVPEGVGAVFREAERARAMGMEHAAGLSYGKALDLGLKIMDGSAKGSLASRIDKLAEIGRIPKELAEWCHDLRGIRNEATHEEEALSKEELRVLAGAIELVLMYLFTLPGMLQSRKALTATDS